MSVWEKKDFGDSTHEDSSWKTITRFDVDSDLKAGDPALWAKWIVKLKFIFGGNESFGTGFYIDLPTAKTNIIVTAGHNLINENGERAQRLRVFAGKDKDRKDMVIEIPDSDFFLSESYEKTPKPSNKANDWGVIFTKKTAGVRLGFGFSLLFGIDLKGAERKQSPLDKILADGELILGGYTDANSDSLTLQMGKGSMKARNLDQLAYKLSTQRGLSGSPIFTTYNGFETVVAVHNHGKSESSEFSYGSRLNFRVLRTIFRKAGVEFPSVPFKVAHKEAPQAGIFLTFVDQAEYATIQLSDGEGPDREPTDRVTRFDVIPAESGSARDDLTAEGGPYAFSIALELGKPEASRQWLIWNDIESSVTLTPILQPACFILLRKKQAGRKAKPSYRAIIVRGTERKELKFGAHRLKEEDLELGIVPRTAEIEFVEEKDSTLKYNHFAFE